MKIKIAPSFTAQMYCLLLWNPARLSVCLSLYLSCISILVSASLSFSLSLPNLSLLLSLFVRLSVSLSLPPSVSLCLLRLSVSCVSLSPYSVLFTVFLSFLVSFCLILCVSLPQQNRGHASHRVL